MRKFDFVIVPVARAGGTALHRFLSLHPDVYAVPKGDFDKTLETNREQDLLENLQPFMQRYPNVKVGLVEHKFVGKPETIERISRIVDTDNLIFVVRDPFQAIQSMINHIVICWHCNYDYTKAGLPWLDGVHIDRDPEAILDGARRRASGAKACGEKGSRDMSPEVIVHGQRRVLRYDEIIQNYRPHFPRYEIFEYSALFGKNHEDGLGKLFARLGVDPSYVHPTFGSTQAGQASRFMVHNPVNLITPYHMNLAACLSFSAAVRYAIESEAYEIASLHGASIRAQMGVEDGVSLVTRPHDWLNIPRKIRVSIQSMLERFLENVLFPLWKENYDSVTQTLAPYRGTALSEEAKRAMIEFVGDDLRGFLERHPDFTRHWPAVASLL